MYIKYIYIYINTYQMSIKSIKNLFRNFALVKVEGYLLKKLMSKLMKNYFPE